MGSIDHDYVARFNRVIDHIERNLAKDLSLEELAGVAHFSKFHFHRLFQLYQGETLFRFIRRLRLEKAASLLLMDRTATITSIALRCGFENASAFSRSFREYFGVSASRMRETGGAKAYEERMLSYGIDERSDMIEQWERFPVTAGFDEHGRFWKSDTIGGRKREVRVKRFDDIQVAYVRHTGPYAADAELFARLFHTLFTWATARELVHFPLDTYCLYHDSPDITAEEKLRVSACLTVPPETPTGGEIGRLVIPGGTYAVVSMELAPSDYGEAWSWAYRRWLPTSGYDPDDKNCFEHIHIESPEHLGVPRHRVNICIPVRPAV